MDSTFNRGTPGNLFDVEHSGEAVGKTSQVVSFADYRARRTDPHREPTSRLALIRTAGLAISPRQAEHRRRMLQHLAGLTSNL